jgi:hypothetical protein
MLGVLEAEARDKEACHLAARVPLPICAAPWRVDLLHSSPTT